MKEDIILNIDWGKPKAVRDSDATVDAGARSPALTHRSPIDTCGTFGDFRGLGLD
jgi:hypothetical protein